MLQLTLTNTTENSHLKERLNSLLIPSEIKINPSVTIPLLKDGDKNIEGFSEIETYLDELERFTKNWYACRCDMFPQ